MITFSHLVIRKIFASLCLFYSDVNHSVSVDDSLLNGPEKKTVGKKYDKTRFGLKLALIL